MNFTEQLPPQFASQDEQNQMTKINENILIAKTEVNNKNAEYRQVVSEVNDKVILLAGGSLSLLLTFLGVLFNSSRDTSELDYNFIIISLFAFFVTMLLLLLSKWFRAKYVSRTVFGHFQDQMKQLHESQLRLVKLGGDIYDADNESKLMTPVQVEKYKDAISNQIDAVSKELANSRKKENLEDKLAAVLNVSGFVTLLVGYASATIFFLSVIRAMYQ